MAPPALHALERTLLSGLRRSALLPPKSTGLVSVSGGADSTALLLLLHTLVGRLALRLEVLHFDHGLRPESPQEAEWVRALAERLGLPFHLRRGFREGTDASDRGVQARARAWRRRESVALLRARGAAWIATGHQREDHWETLLLKLMRGAHLSRLQGMAPRHGPWVRPLLGVHRAELERYLRARGEGWLEDPSNRSPAYRRNRVRHELAPLLDSLTPGGAGARLDALERQSRALADWIAAEPAPPQNDPRTSPHWIEAAALRREPALLRQAHLHDFLAARMPGLVDAATLERAGGLLERDTPWALHLSARRSLLGRGERILLERRAAESGAALTERTVAGFRVLTPEAWAVRLTPRPAPPPRPLAATAEGETEDGRGEPAAKIVLFNLDPSLPLTVRARQPGDRIRLPGEAKPVKVAEVLRDSGVPLWERERVPVVLSGDTVVAVFPDRIAAGHEAAQGSGAGLCVTVRAGNSETGGGGED
jgi:tRNA(Ile)-lysidine synthase